MYTAAMTLVWLVVGIVMFLGIAFLATLPYMVIGWIGGAAPVVGFVLLGILLWGMGAKRQ